MDEGTVNLSEKFVGKFYGPEKVTGFEATGGATLTGDVVFEITTEQGRKYLVPKKSLVIISDEKKDWNYIRDTKVSLMVPELVRVVSDYDLPSSQITYMAAIFGQQLSNHLDRAHNYLWFGDDSRFVPGFDPLNDITLLMADRINATIPSREGVLSPYIGTPDTGTIEE